MSNSVIEQPRASRYLIAAKILPFFTIGAYHLFSFVTAMNKSGMVDLTTGPTFINMVRFSVPIMLQGSFQIIYTLTDRFWLGRLDKEAMASVTVVFPVIFFMISIVIGISIGAGILIAQFYGADDRERVNLTARNYIVVGGIAILALSVLMVLFAGDVLRILKTPADIEPAAEAYLKIQFAGLLFIFGFFGASSIFRGLGDSMTPTKIAALVGVINLVLDPMFIFGIGPFPRCEVAGAAIATVIAYAIGTTLIFAILAVKSDYVTLSPKGFYFDWTIIANIMKVGLPTSGTVMMVSLSFMVLMRIVNEYGTAVVAAYGIGTALDQLVQMPSQSFGMSMSTIAGQNIGAGKLHRVRKFLRETLALSFCVAAFFSTILWFGSGPVTRLFLEDPDDYDEVLKYVVMYIHIGIIRYAMMSMFFPIIGVIRGAGDAMTSMIIVAFTQLIIRIPLAWYIAMQLDKGFIGVPIAISSSTVFGMIIAGLYYRFGPWVRRGRYILDNVGSTDRSDSELAPE